jgi:hypothetical protein
VVATAAHRLTAFDDAAGKYQLAILQNGAPLRTNLQPRPGDRLSVSIAVPVRTVLPRWLQTLKFWGSGEQMQVLTERQMPGRDIPLAGER